MEEFFSLKNLNQAEVYQLIDDVSSDFKFMGESISPQSSIYNKLFLKSEIKESVTFFGGSFNPIHLGHLECLRLCPEKNIVIVLDRNPQKEIREINLLSELQQIVSELKNTTYSIYPKFWAIHRPNLTSSWIIKVNIPEVNLLMGDDSFVNFFTWKNPEIILNKIKKLYIVLRNHHKSELNNIYNQCHKINPNLDIIFLEGNKFRELSSSSMRAKN